MKGKQITKMVAPVLQIQIRIRIRILQIHMCLGLLDLGLDPLVRDMDADPALELDTYPSIIQQKRKKNLEYYCFLTSF